MKIRRSGASHTLHMVEESTWDESDSEKSDDSDELIPDSAPAAGSPRSSPQKRPVETPDMEVFYA